MPEIPVIYQVCTWVVILCGITVFIAATVWAIKTLSRQPIPQFSEIRPPRRRLKKPQPCPDCRRSNSIQHVTSDDDGQKGHYKCDQCGKEYVVDLDD